METKKSALFEQYKQITAKMSGCAIVTDMRV